MPIAINFGDKYLFSYIWWLFSKYVSWWGIEGKYQESYLLLKHIGHDMNDLVFLFFLGSRQWRVCFVLVANKRLWLLGSHILNKYFTTTSKYVDILFSQDDPLTSHALEPLILIHLLVATIPLITLSGCFGNGWNLIKGEEWLSCYRSPLFIKIVER